MSVYPGWNRSSKAVRPSVGFLWGSMIVEPQRNIDSSQVVCQHRIAVTLFVKSILCKGKKKSKKGDKKEIRVLDGSVYVLVDSSEAALPCVTWHSSA